MKKTISTILSISLLLVTLASCLNESQVTSMDSAASSNNLSSEQIESKEESFFSEISSNISSLEPYDIPFIGDEVDYRHVFMDGEIEGVIPENLPEYEDGSIELYRHEKQDGTPVNRERRYCFYRNATDLMGELREFQVPGGIPGLRDKLEEWTEEYYGQSDGNFSVNAPEPEEMALVSLIKYFNIPRDVMEMALEEYINGTWSEFNNEEDIYTEYGELPNLDIVYTLDNDIINEYYRYA